ncbi:MAG: hypothetical protein IJF40_04600 [Clostridia bacterium]|nr:hypothetical protein [Clostridia bacterium]
MTAQEAIQFLKETIAGCTFTKDKQLKEVCEVSIEALGKQIPKKHHHTRVIEVNCRARESVCPSCLSLVITTEDEYPKHCTWCGSKIDWSDTE